MNQVHYSGCSGYWGFGPTSDWFSTWVIHPEYGGANYVFFVGDSLPRYRFQKSVSLYDRDFSRRFKNLRYDSIITARKIETAIVPVSVSESESAVPFRQPIAYRGPSTEEITLDLGSVISKQVAIDDPLLIRIYHLGMRLVAEERLCPMFHSESSCQFILHAPRVFAPGLYVVTHSSTSSNVHGACTLVLD